MTIQKTSLHSEHLALNAKMATFAGFDMPLQYSSVKEEASAVRKNAGVFDVSHMGEFFVEGPDAVEFVDYIMTNDFSNAAIGKAVYGLLCRENGTVIDDLIAYKLDTQKVLICVNASNIKKDWEWINSHTEEFNIELSNQSDNYSLLAIQGPKSATILKEIGLNYDIAMEYYSIAEGNFETSPFILARTGYTGEDGFELFANHETIKKVWKLLMTKNVAPCGLAARDVLRLEVCYPLYGHELNDEITPLDAGLKWTVKLDKPRFIGKDFLSTYKPKFRLVKLSMEKGIPREGYPILDSSDKTVGKVTSGTMSVELSHGICLGLVEKELFPDNKEFKINIRNKNLDAKYHAKAFFTGGHI